MPDAIPKQNMQAALYQRLAMPNIPSLDGLRGIAVALVIFYHFGLTLGFYPLPGYLGVMMFFVLSGFLITWLLLKESGKTGDISLKQFYIRRTLRIFPAFYAFWIFTVGLRLATHNPVSWGYAVSAFFYVSDYYIGLAKQGTHFMGQTWSLGVEEQFYLLWPFLFWKGRNNLRRLATFLVVVIAGVWVYRVILRLVLGVSPEYLQYAFDCRIDGLFMGCLLAILLKQQRLNTLIKAACFSAAAPLVPISLLALTVHLSNSLGPNYAQTVGFPAEQLCVAVLLIQLITFSDRTPWKWLNSSLARFVGRISYSLYLYHALSFHYLPNPLRDWVEGSSRPVKVLVGIAISMSFAVASYYGIERVFLKLKRKHEIVRVDTEDKGKDKPGRYEEVPDRGHATLGHASSEPYPATES
jgi:peptidoglycan/LPS O-acetylase OafA/YrhL